MMHARRYKRLCERERELIARIKAIQQRAQDEMQPYVEELGRLRSHRDRPILRTADGTLHEYIGPMPPYELPDEEREQ